MIKMQPVETAYAGTRSRVPKPSFHANNALPVVV